LAPAATCTAFLIAKEKSHYLPDNDLLICKLKSHYPLWRIMTINLIPAIDSHADKLRSRFFKGSDLEQEDIINSSNHFQIITMIYTCQDFLLARPAYPERIMRLIIAICPR